MACDDSIRISSALFLLLSNVNNSRLLPGFRIGDFRQLLLMDFKSFPIEIQMNRLHCRRGVPHRMVDAFITPATSMYCKCVCVRAWRMQQHTRIPHVPHTYRHARTYEHMQTSKLTDWKSEHWHAHNTQLMFVWKYRSSKRTAKNFCDLHQALHIQCVYDSRWFVRSFIRSLTHSLSRQLEQQPYPLFLLGDGSHTLSV